MEKRGLSPVIATIAIILLTLAAAGFIAGFVVPFVKDNLYGSTECVEYKEHFSFDDEFEYNCYVNIDGDYLYAISIRGDALDQEDIDRVAGFKLQFLAEGSSEPTDVINGSFVSSESNGIRMLSVSRPEIRIPGPGEVQTYVYNSTGLYQTIEVYPLLKSGKLCGRTDSVRVQGIVCAKTVSVP